MRSVVRLIFLVVPLFLIGCSQTSQDLEPLKEDVKSLKEGQEAIVKELGEIKKLVQTKTPPRRPEFKEAVLDIGDDPFKGKKDAMVTLVDFSDYE